MRVIRDFTIPIGEKDGLEVYVDMSSRILTVVADPMGANQAYIYIEDAPGTHFLVSLSFLWVKDWKEIPKDAYYVGTVWGTDYYRHGFYHLYCINHGGQQ